MACRPAFAALAVAAALALPLPAMAAEPEGTGIWRRAVDKMGTYATVSTIADAAILSAMVGGGAVATAGYLAAGTIMGSASYYLHEVAWHYLGPETTTSDISIDMQKTITWRIASGARAFALGGWFSGAMSASVGFAAASQVADTAVYYLHETLWRSFGSPVAR
ncbi:putative membrane protein DUF2061 [Stella humosa]|uniref:Putative membrane protein DUF2061 n=1 Tax=Stella humosa TaxID=94 RepID=A0A3N1M854_9PROT|nr:DUF2061 domain-containing protein [Stella humosa]ROP99860.1 putative membrane protein DUF2061 [Stella humosa]BBK30911.1 hypothetical protein STHU_15450 [Stella humosa]